MFNINQKSIIKLFAEKDADFLIPDYQRPYAWGKRECEKLWSDVVGFAIPDGDSSAFNDRDEYFLGPIVFFKNKSGKQEVIDGQQRLTTILLLLRAFYDKFLFMKDDPSIATLKRIESCIWKSDEFDKPNKSELKISSDVATDEDNEEFLSILLEGTVNPKSTSAYALNYAYLSGCVKKFIDEYPTYIASLAMRFMKNCILLPIETESQVTALRVFSTLNDRGKPLADADIFKAQLYRHHADKGQKADFIARWKALAEVCEKSFKNPYTQPLDELFTNYMYYLRATEGNKDTTIEGLRTFYENDGYKRIKRDGVLVDLESLADFWHSVEKQDESRFGGDVLRRLYVLDYVPNGLWRYAATVYFMKHKDADGNLDDAAFERYLDKLTAFVLGVSFVRSGLSALRIPMFEEMVRIAVGGDAEAFGKHKIDTHELKYAFGNFYFDNRRGLTKSMLVWWAMRQEGQTLPPLGQQFDIEHIYSKNRKNIEGGDADVESLGNKSLLEKRINIRASDYKFADKKRYYLGSETRERTCIAELVAIANAQDDFVNADITARREKITEAFMAYVEGEGVLTC